MIRLVRRHGLHGLRVRQVDLEHGAVAGLAVDPDMPAALFHDSVNGRQAEAAALALFLRGEERLEDARSRRLIHAFAGVRHGDHDVVAGNDAGVIHGVGVVEIHGRGFEHQTAAVRHRVAAVHRQAHQHLLDRHRIHLDRRQRRRENGHELDIGAEKTAQQLFQLAHDRVDVHNLRLQHLPPAERQQLARQRRRPFARVPDLFEIGPQRVVERNVVEHQVAVTEDRSEQIVEIVGDAAGELANRLHLLRLPQLFFQLAPIGQIADIHDDRPHRPVGQAVHGDALHDPP